MPPFINKLYFTIIMENYVSALSQSIMTFSTVFITIFTLVYYIRQIFNITPEAIILLICVYLLGLTLTIIITSSRLKWEKKRIQWNIQK